MRATKEITVGQPSAGFMEITNLDQALKVSEMVSKSQFCPKQFQNRPGDILVCLQIGQELGIKPMQALQNIAVINGRPTLWGDAMLAVCRQSPEFEYIDEEIDSSRMIATCKVKRKNQPEITEVFSSEDAKKAGLWGKPGPWTQYPKRMLQMRARSFALRNAFADCLRGIQAREEAADYAEIKDAKVVTISEEQVAEIEELASQAEVSDADLCRGAKISSMEQLYNLTYDDYRNICIRLKKKIKKIEGENAIRELTRQADEEEDEINIETGEIIE